MRGPVTKLEPAGDGGRAGRRDLFVLALCLLGAAASSWARAAVVGTIRVDDVDAPLVHQLWPSFLMGLLVGVAAWRYLALQRSAALSWRALLVGAVAFHLAAASALPLTSNDLFSNLAYGRLAALGRNPYLVAPHALSPDDPFRAFVGLRWIDTPIAYGPIAAAVNTLAARAGHVAVAVAIFKLLLLAASIGVVWLAFRTCRDHLDPARARSSFVLIAFAPVLAWEVSAQAHNDGIMVLAMTGFVWAALGGRQWLAVGCLAAALYTKLAAAPVLVLYLVMVGRRRPARAAAMALLTAALGALLVAPYWDGPVTLRGPFTTVGADTLRTTRSALSLICGIVGLVDPVAQRLTYRGGWLLGTALLVVVGVRGLLRVRTARDVVHHGLLVVLAYCLVTPWFQAWYVTWLLPLALAEPDARWQRLAAVYAALAALLYALPIDPLTSIAVDVVVLLRVPWDEWPSLRRAQRSPVGRAEASGDDPVDAAATESAEALPAEREAVAGRGR